MSNEKYQNGLLGSRIRFCAKTILRELEKINVSDNAKNRVAKICNYIISEVLDEGGKGRQDFIEEILGQLYHLDDIVQEIEKNETEHEVKFLLHCYVGDMFYYIEEEKKNLSKLDL